MKKLYFLSLLSLLINTHHMTYTATPFVDRESDDDDKEDNDDFMYNTEPAELSDHYCSLHDSSSLCEIILPHKIISKNNPKPKEKHILKNVKMFLSRHRNCPIAINKPCNGLAPLHCAIKHHYNDIVRCLLKQSCAYADQDNGTDAHFTPLMEAINYDNFKAVQILINQGANVNFINDNGISALSMALTKYMFLDTQYENAEPVLKIINLLYSYSDSLSEECRIIIRSISEKGDAQNRKKAEALHTIFK